MGLALASRGNASGKRVRGCAGNRHSGNRGGVGCGGAVRRPALDRAWSRPGERRRRLDLAEPCATCALSVRHGWYPFVGNAPEPARAINYILDRGKYETRKNPDRRSSNWSITFRD